MAGLAEFERDLIRERVKSGLAAARAAASNSAGNWASVRQTKRRRRCRPSRGRAATWDSAEYGHGERKARSCTTFLTLVLLLSRAAPPSAQPTRGLQVVATIDQEAVGKSRLSLTHQLIAHSITGLCLETLSSCQSKCAAARPIAIVEGSTAAMATQRAGVAMSCSRSTAG
jgi:hypothetical protein